MPKAPWAAYEGKFLGMGVFLGTGNVRLADKVFVSYEEAKALIRAMENPPKSDTEWRDAVRDGRIPASIPRNLKSAYGAEFKGFGDLLGTGRTKHQRRDYPPIEEATAWVVANIPLPRTVGMFMQLAVEGRLPANIPKSPLSVCWHEVPG
jgi:hypothetical protein